MTKTSVSKPENSPAVAADPKPGRTASLIALLSRKEGATIDELVTHFGWQAHTARAMLSGLRKKGHAIVREKRGEVACYVIRDAA